MQPILTDLATLEQEGITVTRPEGEYQIRGALTMVVADDLGAHCLGGFMESFSVFRNCRFCMVKREDMLTSLDGMAARPRTVAGYNEQVRLVTEVPGLANTYGVKADSPLNTLEYYHVIGGLPPDIGHDLFESGIVCEVLDNLIRHYVRVGVFSLSFLNDQIVGFPFASTDKVNKPITLATQLGKLKVKQTCMQIWCLLRVFPLLVGCAVPEGDGKWEVLLSLLTMVEEICAPVTSVGDCALMKDYITQFLGTYKQEFPHIHFKPKAHYTLHYPEQTLRFGPLMNCWTMRFEGKHNFFKEVAHRTKNRKNLCKTMAYRHQYLQCLWAESSSFLCADGDYQQQHGTTISVLTLAEGIQQLLQPHVADEPTVFQCKSVKVDGQLYSPGTAVVTGFENDDLQFAKYESSFILGGQAYLLCQTCKTVQFVRHYHCYEIEESGTFELYVPRDLLDRHPLAVYKLNQANVVILRNKILTD